MNSLHTIFRWMTAIWLVLVICLGVAVSRSTSTSAIGNTMAFLFSHAGERPAPMPPEPRPLPAPEPPAAPEQPEWVELKTGRNAGSGSIGAPEIETRGDGSVVVTMPLNGTAGDVSFYTPTNVNAATADLVGKWTSAPFVKKPLSGGCLSMLQMARHEGYLRVSGVAAKGVAKLEAKAERSEAKGAVRVVFAPAGGGAK